MGDSDDGLVLLVTGCVDLACCFGVKRKGRSTDSDDGFVLFVTGYVDLACCFGVKREGGSTDFDDDSVLFITGHLDLLLCFYFNGVEIKGGNFRFWKTDDGSAPGHVDLAWC